VSGQYESDDYEYDMAHEVKAYLAAHPPKQPGPAKAGRPDREAHRAFDPDGDIGYDEAHQL
jgi:hypothetical protein